jgi:acyl dehydratase
VPAGYSLARLTGRWGERLSMGIFLTYLVPSTLLFIPFSRLVSLLGLQNSLLSLVLVYPTFTVPFCTWLLMGFFKSLPREVEESAMVDGCGRMGTIWRIVLPLSLPGLLTVVIFTMTLVVQEFVYSLTFISSVQKMTVSVGVPVALVRGDVYYWGSLMAACLITSIPIAVIYNLFPRSASSPVSPRAPVKRRAAGIVRAIRQAARKRVVSYAGMTVPSGRFFEQIEIGEEYESPGRTVTETDVVMFAGLSGDYNVLHTDAEFMKGSIFGERIAHGLLVLTMQAGLFTRATRPYATTAFAALRWKFKGPVKIGDTIRVRAKVLAKRDGDKPDHGLVTLERQVLNQRGEVVQGRRDRPLGGAPGVTATAPSHHVLRRTSRWVSGEETPAPTITEAHVALYRGLTGDDLPRRGWCPDLLPFVPLHRPRLAPVPPAARRARLHEHRLAYRQTGESGRYRPLPPQDDGQARHARGRRDHPSARSRGPARRPRAVRALHVPDRQASARRGVMLDIALIRGGERHGL